MFFIQKSIITTWLAFTDRAFTQNLFMDEPYKRLCDATQMLVALCVYLLIAYQKFISQTRYGLQAVFRLMQFSAFVRNSIADLLYPRKSEPPNPQLDLSLRAA